jgi:hypothetical protein
MSSWMMSALGQRQKGISTRPAERRCRSEACRQGAAYLTLARTHPSRADRGQPIHPGDEVVNSVLCGRVPRPRSPLQPRRLEAGQS